MDFNVVDRRGSLIDFRGALLLPRRLHQLSLPFPDRSLLKLVLSSNPGCVLRRYQTSALTMLKNNC